MGLTTLVDTSWQHCWAFLIQRKQRSAVIFWLKILVFQLFVGSTTSLSIQNFLYASYFTNVIQQVNCRQYRKLLLVLQPLKMRLSQSVLPNTTTIFYFQKNAIFFRWAELVTLFSAFLYKYLEWLLSKQNVSSVFPWGHVQDITDECNHGNKFMEEANIYLSCYKYIIVCYCYLRRIVLDAKVALNM